MYVLVKNQNEFGGPARQPYGMHCDTAGSLSETLGLSDPPIRRPTLMIEVSPIVKNPEAARILKSMDARVLVRGLVRLPTANKGVTWLLNFNRTENEPNWLQRLSVSIAKLAKVFPRTTVTFELAHVGVPVVADGPKVYEQVSRGDMGRAFKEYLNAIHRPNPYIAYVVASLTIVNVPADLEDKFGVDLGQLFLKSQTPPPYMITADQAKQYVLMVYLSFPPVKMKRLVKPERLSQIVKRARDLLERNKRSGYRLYADLNPELTEKLECLLLKVWDQSVDDRYLPQSAIEVVFSSPKFPHRILGSLRRLLISKLPAKSSDPEFARSLSTLPEEVFGSSSVLLRRRKEQGAESAGNVEMRHWIARQMKNPKSIYCCDDANGKCFVR